MKATRVFIYIMTTMIYILTGCQIYAEDEAEKALIESKLQREMNPDISDEDLKKFINDNNQFAFDLYHELSKTSQNLFFSPISISETMAMVYPGTKGATKNQIASAMRYTLDETALNSAFNKLDLHLNFVDKQNSYTFSLINAIWPQKGYSYEEEYLDTIKRSFDAGIRALDYAKDSESSREIINDWVSEQTKQKIQEIIPQGSITEYTKLVLTNTVYFQAKWVKKFNPQSTIKKEFLLLDGRKKLVDMMYQYDGFIYSEGANYQAVTLPYASEHSSMVIILPKEGSFEEVSQSIDNDFIDALEANKTFATLSLSLPRFEFTVEQSLTNPLNSLGISDAFTDRADFTKMSKDGDIYISDIFHKAYIKVDEEGTEALAATSILLSTTGIVVNTIQREMNINRAFIFFIKDNQTSQILFIGNILDPSLK